MVFRSHHLSFSVTTLSFSVTTLSFSVTEGVLFRSHNRVPPGLVPATSSGQVGFVAKAPLVHGASLDYST